MKKIAFILTLVLSLCVATSIASAVGIQAGLALSNSNIYMEDTSSGGASYTFDMNMHYGLDLAVDLPINPMMEVLLGLTYYLPASPSDDTLMLTTDDTVAFMPIYASLKFSIPGLGMTGVNPYAGIGINYTTWTSDPAPDTQPTAGLGYYGFVGASFGNIFAELGYISMRGSITDMAPGVDVNIESRGIVIKGGMLLGI